MKYFALSLAIVASTLIIGCAGGDRTPLDAYVAKSDPAYTWKLVRSARGDGFTHHAIAMTSQSWLTESEVDRTIWEHWLSIVVPDTVTSDTALLMIGGGKNGDPVPTNPNPAIVATALDTNAVTAELKMVPNQPLTFVEPEPRKRVEDDLIAYAWDKHLRGGRDEWLPRFPMTKSVVRAMDTVSAFIKDRGEARVNTYVVAGGSKRGWTTWTTAAVDDRVIAFAPIVIDMLNLEPSFQHHWEVYGFWAPAVKEYEDMQIMEWTGSAQYQELRELVEPYEYRHRYGDKPKFIINASGDQFFLPDSSQFYFDDLPGEKHIRYVPNSGHSLRKTDAWESLAAFFHTVVNDAPRPRMTWTVQADGAIRVKTETQPVAVKLWQATNPDARDFRIDTIGEGYASTDLTDQGNGVYIGRVTTPPKGWTAFFVECTYDIGGPRPMKTTTEVKVLPETLPFTYTPPARPPL
jgi:PhoPQ-activated pathogenicity-related protein